MTERALKITKNTLVPIGILIPLLSLVWWVSALNKDVQANQKAIAEQKTVSEKTADYMHSIDSRLSNIEGAVGVRRGK